MSIAEQLMRECEQAMEDKLRECFVTKLDDIEDIEDLVKEVADFIDGNHRNGFIREVVNQWLENREEEEEDDD